MTILLPDTATDQEVKYIPSITSDVTKVEFLDEQQNVVTEATFNSQVVESFYTKINVAIELKDGSIYMMIFYNGDDVIFRDKCFSTSQPVSTFSVNHNVYKKAPSTPNQYILYGQ